jgi:hypothetical protein
MTYEKPEIRDFGSIADHTYFDVLSFAGASGIVPPNGGPNDTVDL